MKAEAQHDQDSLWMWDVTDPKTTDGLLHAALVALHESEDVVPFKHGAEYAARYLADMRMRHTKRPDGTVMSLGERSAAAAIHMLDGLDQKQGHNPLEHEVQLTLCTEAIEVANNGLSRIYNESLAQAAA